MPNTRKGDPITSHEAEKSVKNITGTQRAILAILRLPTQDEDLIRRYEALAEKGFAPKASPSGIRSRRAELVDRGLVEDSGIKVRTKSGRNAILWLANL